VKCRRIVVKTTGIRYFHTREEAMEWVSAKTKKIGIPIWCPIYDREDPKLSPEDIKEIFGKRQVRFCLMWCIDDSTEPLPRPFPDLRLVK
jgi:hypothetical protein